MTRRAVWTRVRGVRGFLRQERLLVAVLLVIVGCGWVFVEVLDEVLEGEPEEFDGWVAGLLEGDAGPGSRVGPGWLVTAAGDLTALGSAAVLGVVVALAVGWFALRRSWGRALLVLAASAGGQALSSLLKLVFGRERPDEAGRLAAVSTASFPSGHAMMAAVVYLTLGVLVASTRERRAERVFIIGAASLLTGVVGATRVYLGVHHATDVLAGWSIGLAWALGGLLAARRLWPGRAGPAGAR